MGSIDPASSPRGAEMRVLTTTLLVTTVLGSIGLAGCQTTEDDYYYGDYPQRRVVRTYEDDNVYVRRPNWRYVEDRPSRDYGYDRPTRVVTPPRWAPRDEPRPMRWDNRPPPVVHAPPPPVVHAPPPPPQGMGGHRPPPPDDRRRHWPDAEQGSMRIKPM